MAKPQERLNVIHFPTGRIIPFPTKLCGCGCGLLLNEQEDCFIKVDSVRKWYVDEVCMMDDLDIEERDGRYRVRHTDYWYRSKNELFEDYQAYWVNEYAPIA